MCLLCDYYVITMCVWTFHFLLCDCSVTGVSHGAGPMRGATQMDATHFANPPSSSLQPDTLPPPSVLPPPREAPAANALASAPATPNATPTATPAATPVEQTGAGADPDGQDRARGASASAAASASLSTAFSHGAGVEFDKIQLDLAGGEGEVPPPL